MSQTANRIVKNTGFLYGRMGITMFISLWTTRIILNTLGASDFGIFAIVGGAIGMFGFINGALSGSTQRFMSYAEGEGKDETKASIFNISVILHFFIGVFTVLVLIAVGGIFFNGVLNIPTHRIEAAKVVYGCVVLSSFINMLRVPYDAVLNAHENMKYYAEVGIMESVIKLIIAYICVYTLFDKLIVYGVLMTLLPLLMLCIMAIYCNKHYSECALHLFRIYDIGIIKQMTSFMGWSVVSTASSMCTMQGMSVLLNMFGGVVVNTAHGIANQLSAQLLLFSSGMLKALNPVIVKSKGAGDNKRMLQAALTGNKLSFYLFAVFAIPFFVETPYILNLWLKQVPEWTVLFVRFLIIKILLEQTMVTYGTCIMATGNIKSFTLSTSAIWILPLISGFFLYRAGAPIYTIYVLIIFAVLLRIANTLYFSHKQCSLDVIESLRSLYIPCTLISGMVYVLLSFINSLLEESLASLFTILVLGIFSFSVICYLALCNSSERMYIRDTLYSLKNRFPFCKF